MGQNPQSSQQEFEKIIRDTLETFKTDLPVWVEFESSYLGTLQMPKFLLQKFSEAKIISINREREKRIQRIVETYAKHSIDELLTATSKLKKRLSPKKYRLARKSIKEKDFETAVSILITYYDRVYENAMKDDRNLFLGEVYLKSNDIDENTSQVLGSYYKTL